MAKMENLPKMDLVGTCDPFYSVEFNKTKIKSDSMDNNQDPKFY